MGGVVDGVAVARLGEAGDRGEGAGGVPVGGIPHVPGVHRVGHFEVNVGEDADSFVDDPGGFSVPRRLGTGFGAADGGLGVGLGNERGGYGQPGGEVGARLSQPRHGLRPISLGSKYWSTRSNGGSCASHVRHSWATCAPVTLMTGSVSRWLQGPRT